MPFWKIRAKLPCIQKSGHNPQPPKLSAPLIPRSACGRQIFMSFARYHAQMALQLLFHPRT